MMREFEIVIQPIGDVPPELTGWLGDALEQILPVSTSVKAAVAAPRRAYYSDRRQYLANYLLRLLEDGSSTRLNRKVLGITTQDIFAPGRTFVFGQAIVSGKVAVISTSRLDVAPRMNGDLVKRTVKEAVHEIGHTLGLQHCDNHRCVMSFSESLTQADAKGARFCQRCQDRLASTRGRSRTSV